MFETEEENCPKKKQMLGYLSKEIIEMFVEIYQPVINRTHNAKRNREKNSCVMCRFFKKWKEESPALEGGASAQCNNWLH